MTTKQAREVLAAVRIDPFDQRLQHAWSLFIVDLAGPCSVVTTATILQHQLADLGLAAAVQN